MPILNNCCFCCSLRTGSLILGILSLIGCIIGTIAMIAIIVLFPSIREEAIKQEPSAQQYMDALLAVMIICLIFVIIELAISSLLIHGINKDRPGFMMPYIVMNIVSVILNIVGIIAVSAIGGAKVPNIISSIIGLLFSIYFTLCVYSYYQELRERETSVGPVAREAGISPTKY